MVGIMQKSCAIPEYWNTTDMARGTASGLSMRYSRASRCFFFPSRRRHTRFDCDWNSDVCSSDLGRPAAPVRQQRPRGDRRGRPGAVQRGVRARPGRPGPAACARLLPGRAGRVRLRPVQGRLAVNSSAIPLLAIGAGALTGAGLFVLIAAIRGLPPKAKSQGPSALERAIKDMFSIRGAVAVIVGILTLLITRWVVAGIGMALLAYSWRSLSGAASPRQALAPPGG